MQVFSANVPWTITGSECTSSSATAEKSLVIFSLVYCLTAKTGLSHTRWRCMPRVTALPAKPPFIRLQGHLEHFRLCHVALWHVAPCFVSVLVHRCSCGPSRPPNALPVDSRACGIRSSPHICMANLCCVSTALQATYPLARHHSARNLQMICLSRHYAACSRGICVRGPALTSLYVLRSSCCNARCLQRSQLRCDGHLSLRQ